MAILYVEMDLAKNVFAVYGVDERSARQGASVRGRTAAVHHRYGGVRGRTPLGQAFRPARTPCV